MKVKRILWACLILWVYWMYAPPVPLGMTYQLAPLYPLLGDLTILFHFLFAIVGVILFFDTFNLKGWYWNLAIIPYVVIAAFPHSTAIPAFLALLTVWLLREGYRWGYAMTALSYLARTEWLIFILLRRWWATVPVAIAVAFMALTTGSIVTKNSSAVFYISLGQLPNNAWGIVHLDAYADSVAKANGFSGAWEAPAFFRRAALDSILSRPSEYVRKCVYNLYRATTRGVWLGTTGFHAHWGVKAMQVVCALIILASIVKLRVTDEASRYVAYLVFFVLILQVFGQAEARHTNILWLPLLGMAWSDGEVDKVKKPPRKWLLRISQFFLNLAYWRK